MYFRRLVLTSFATAIIAGLLFSVYQGLFVTPIIMDAEQYELVESAPGPTNSSVQVAEPWSPQEGVERIFYTVSADILTSFAYALLLACAMAFRGKVDMLKGVFWGLGGYICFFIAPGVGLPPEIPGMQAAALENRQIWWLTTAFVTAVGLGLVFYGPIHFKIGAIILLFLPHWMGAPQPEIHGFSHPDPDAVAALKQLWQQFIFQTSLANALLWLIIGSLSGFFSNKIIDNIDTPI